jgi:hypothetical protein
MNVSPCLALSLDMQTRHDNAPSALQRLRRRIETLRPYPSLLLVAVPLAVVEPLKLVIVFMAGEGHWVTGAIAMLCAYAVSLFVTHWLFGVVKPKLLTLPWFARLWGWCVAICDKALKRWRGRRMLAG